MKNEITIPILRQENLVAANMRRDTYAAKRDLQAREFNEAIVTRLLSEKKHKTKCDKCGKEFEAGLTSPETLTCPDCK
jgi:hypothetical protein